MEWFSGGTPTHNYMNDPTTESGVLLIVEGMSFDHVCSWVLLMTSGGIAWVYVVVFFCFRHHHTNTNTTALPRRPHAARHLRDVAVCQPVCGGPAGSVAVQPASVVRRRGKLRVARPPRRSLQPGAHASVREKTWRPFMRARGVGNCGAAPFRLSTLPRLPLFLPRKGCFHRRCRWSPWIDTGELHGRP